MKQIEHLLMNFGTREFELKERRPSQNDVTAKQTMRDGVDK